MGPPLPVLRTSPFPRHQVSKHHQKETPPPHTAPKIAGTATSMVNGTCHNPHRLLLTKEYKLVVAATRWRRSQCR